jgi:hypothetical protein
MERSRLAKQLEHAERQIKMAERHINLQRDIVKLLKIEGGDWGGAELLLHEFEISLALYVSDRQRIVEQLVRLADADQEHSAG